MEIEAKVPIMFLPPREETESDDVRGKARGKFPAGNRCLLRLLTYDAMMCSLLKIVFTADPPKAVEPPRTPSDVVRLNEEYLRYRFHNAIVPRGDTQTLVEFLKNPAVNNRNVWVTDNQDTPLHSAARSRKKS